MTDFPERLYRLFAPVLSSTRNPKEACSVLSSLQYQILMLQTFKNHKLSTTRIIRYERLLENDDSSCDFFQTVRKKQLSDEFIESGCWKWENKRYSFFLLFRVENDVKRLGASWRSNRRPYLSGETKVCEIPEWISLCTSFPPISIPRTAESTESKRASTLYLLSLHSWTYPLPLFLVVATLQSANIARRLI